LVDHIATLEDQVQRLAESNTMWQIRARQAEEQLKQLMAGNAAPENAPESNTVDAEGPQLLQESDPGPTGQFAHRRALAVQHAPNGRDIGESRTVIPKSLICEIWIKGCSTHLQDGRVEQYELLLSERHPPVS